MSEKENQFRSIVNQHLKPVYNYVYRMIGDKDEADDITQEVFIKVWKNLNKIDPQKKFQNWLFQVARNSVIDWFRKKRNISFSTLNSKKDEGDVCFEETLVDSELLPDKIFMKKELGQKLEDLLSKIRPDFKEIILLHYIEGFTLENIGEIIGRPVNTVKSQHQRALAALRKIFLDK